MHSEEDAAYSNQDLIHYVHFKLLSFKATINNIISVYFIPRLNARNIIPCRNLTWGIGNK